MPSKLKWFRIAVVVLVGANLVLVFLALSGRKRASGRSSEPGPAAVPGESSRPAPGFKLDPFSEHFHSRLR